MWKKKSSGKTYSFKAAFPTGGWENVMHLIETFSFSFDEDEDEAAITLKMARVANAATCVEYKELRICNLFKHVWSNALKSKMDESNSLLHQVNDHIEQASVSSFEQACIILKQVFL